MGDLDDKRIRTLAVKAMASIICSSSVSLANELATWRLLRSAGFSAESIALLLPEVRREVVRRRSRLLGSRRP